jgi:UDP-N-acetylmuramate--alanine ligase
MVAEVLTQGGLDPTVVIGGRVGSLKSGAKLGGGEVMVAEADESDGSFLKMKPTIAVVTNIDREHLDYYGGLPAIRQAFTDFLARVPFYGAAIGCIDDSNVRTILAGVDRKCITYGLDPGADVRAVDVEIEGFSSSYLAHGPSGRLGQVQLAQPGRHLVLNSLAAIAVGLELDVPFESIAASLAGFHGVDRRMQRRGEFDGTIVLDDYAHHPTEIVATLGAVHEGFKSRTLAVFQPHRYSRTEALLEEFGGAFGLADLVIVIPIYAAGEKPIEGLDDEKVAETLRRHGHANVIYEPDRGRVIERLREEARSGDVVLTLGAGDVWKIGTELLAGAETGTQPRRSA